MSESSHGNAKTNKKLHHLYEIREDQEEMNKISTSKS